MASRTARVAQTAAAVTTPPKRTKSAFSEGEKQALLQNFDLEVQDKVAYFRSMLAQTLASFHMREETEILAIPRDLRGLTLRELENKWGGGWAGTLHRIKTERFEVEQKKREEQEEKDRDEVVKGKRKRNATASSRGNSPTRSTKNRKSARHEAHTSASKTPASHGASSTTRGKATASKRSTRAQPLSASKATSSLPQDHVFNPTLPPTPYRSQPSPLSHSSHPSRARARSNASESGSSSGESTEQDESDDDDLPDPEAIEARLLAKERSPGSKSKSKKKRAPSLIFRQSLGPGAIAPKTPGPSRMVEDSDEPLATIELSDGRTISFNPFSLTPGRVEMELEEGGVSKEEKARVQNQVHTEVLKCLQARMEKWKV
ncbi:hypothetical protein L198_01932 [Cryptococcus wingfieldii CBS 7118]|uniref:Borealin N-terminal domain-containing protein n=1 Tax=Cryptococcus wingfieldii CBS 7118 TaxID=1295528 RepID=A0A1E3JZB2_9TREE|nr:hypothetical protein L198_01932 [Cryptococcus wingfieldii CBS 7118]ODO05242.1 hypothetical protein L198_01932 [Cryptococcus wingfieldii CBS 7118]